MWRRLYLCWFAFHFLLLISISIHQTAALLDQAVTVSSHKIHRLWRPIRIGTEQALGLALPLSNPFRSTVLTYLECAGIERGYGYFAPNVPDGAKLLFELQYPDGRIEYELPHVATPAAGLRLTTLLENLVRPEFDVVRQPVVKLEAMSVWRDHRDAILVHAVLGEVRLPNPTEYMQGTRERFNPLITYDFAADTREPIHP
jgi:hypothetical protein